MNCLLDKIRPVRGKALLAGGVAAVISLGMLFFGRGQFLQSYLLAYTFWLGVSAGSLGLLLLTHLVVARWALVSQRILEAAAGTLPAMAILFIPIVLGRHDLYEWTHVETVRNDPILSQKVLYLNVPFFLARAALYFGLWILMARLLTRWSRQLDETGDPALGLRMRKLSGIGLVLYGLTVTFAAFDWLMSLEPHWFSTIYGALFMVGQGLSTLAFTAIALHWLAGEGTLHGRVGPQQFHDVGNLMFAFVILWTYMSFGQFLIIWSGNLYEETFWFLDRRYGGWLWVSIFLFLGNFLLPFLLLLMKSNKRRPRILSGIALWVLATRLVDIHWQIAPSFHEQLHVSLLDLALPVAIGGLWIALFLKNLTAASLFPSRDPRVAVAYREEDGHHG